MKNEKCTLQDLKYGKKTENHGKWEKYTAGREIWQETGKIRENEKYTLQDLDYDLKTEKREK